jgi:hypothetical protein
MEKRAFSEADHLTRDVEQMNLDVRIFLDVKNDQRSGGCRAAIKTAQTYFTVIVVRLRRRRRRRSRRS